MQHNLQPHNDQKYITALLNNDTVLLQELYHTYYPGIKHMVLHNSGHVPDANDLFQEALIAIYQKAKTGNFVLSGSFNGYLYKVSKNLWLTHLSKKNRVFKELNAYICEQLGENSFDVTEERRLQEQRIALFEKNFSELGKRCKELLLLSWDKKSMKEVARTLQLTYGFCRKSKAKNCKRLATLIKQSPEYALLKR